MTNRKRLEIVLGMAFPKTIFLWEHDERNKQIKICMSEEWADADSEQEKKQQSGYDSL